ncbi:MAG: nickel pincer cofactor biosynthesis protein LarC [Verrucomicrobiota bacterium]|nr:nickel pincer cofactor biosynthesis protein LarC [Verrucomicrobiota bacterium]
MAILGLVKTLYLDIFSGISGDMFLGAMIDLGVGFKVLESELQKLKMEGYTLSANRRLKCAIDGVKFDVHLAGGGEADHSHSHEHSHTHDHSHEHSHGGDEGHGHSRNFAQISEMIHKSTLSSWVKEKSVAVFQRVANAEGKIHGMPPYEVHFHEVGAVDSIVDIVGGCIALELLGKPRVRSGPVIEGTGFIMCAHGRFPIPAPATLNILAERGIAITQCEEPNELITPTGAALIAEFAESFGTLQNLAPEKVGFGLGTRDCETRPNVLRAVLGKEAAPTGANDWETDTIAVLEANLDDISSEVLGDFVERALKAGALDVVHTPIQMKKNRPGVQLSVFCTEGDADAFSEMILRETSAFGVRRTLTERRKLQRETRSVTTPHGEVMVKLGKLNGEIVQVAPEYESCRVIAAKAEVPLKAVYDAAIAATR